MANALTKPSMGDACRETELSRVLQQLEQARCSLNDCLDNLVKRLEPVTTPRPENPSKDVAEKQVYGSPIACRIAGECEHLHGLIKIVNIQLAQLEV